MTRILVADEAELLLLLQGSYLNRAGWEVLTAGSAEEALRKARAGAPDLVLIDAAIDGSAGIDCCRRLKADAGLGHLPVVLVARQGEREACLAAGADEVVCRPLSREKLCAAVGRTLRVPARASRRRSLSVRVDYFAADREGTAQTKDVSEDGLFLKSRDPFRVGEELQLIFALHAGGRPTIRASGAVARGVLAHPDSPLIPGAGVRFEELSSRDRLAIAQFVAGAEAGRS